MDSDTSSLSSSTISNMPPQKSKIQKSTLRYSSSQLSKSTLYESENDSTTSNTSSKKKKDNDDDYLKMLQSKYIDNNDMEDISPLHPNPKILATPHKPLNEGSRFYMIKRIVIGNVSQYIPPGTQFKFEN